MSWRVDFLFRSEKDYTSNEIRFATNEEADKGTFVVFETEHNGKQAFLLVTNQSMLENNTVLQSSAEVVRLGHEKDYFQRLQELERGIEELKSTIFNVEPEISIKTENEWARRDSNSRSPPC
ncbi:MAG: hypothetical protein ACXV2B_09170 [Halobacteriota archaeon]